MRQLLKKFFILVILLIVVWAAYMVWHARPRTTPPVTTTQPFADQIVLASPVAHQTVHSPLHIYGKARGTWYFEASFPVRIETDSGMVLAAVPAQAQSDWMTTDFVPFDVTVSFTVTSTVPATLILRADNPSGLPEHDKELRVPVVLSP